MALVVVDVALAAHKFLDMYQGKSKYLLVQSRDGRRIQLPLTIFRPFLTHSGIYGTFEVEFDQNYRLLDIKKK
ncbi:topoisomerase II [Marinomonas sp. 42_23_T18]|nr:topoisomerase II [Marinomonas sp. 42_23_T18]